MRSGRKHTVPVGFLILPLLLIAFTLVQSVLALLLRPHPPIPANKLEGLAAVEAFGILLCLLNVRGRLVAIKTSYAVTNRRLLWCVGDGPESIRAIDLTEVATATARSKGGTRWIEFRLRGEEGLFRLPAMPWRFVESGKKGRGSGRIWGVDAPKLVAGLIRDAIRASQSEETMQFSNSD